MAYVGITYANPSFYTQRLQSIVQLTGIQISDTLKPEKEYTGMWTFKQRPLRVRTNTFGDISHIGYCLFDKQVYESYAHKAVLDFAERYALELTLDIDKDLRKKLQIIDKVTCVEGTLSMLAKVSPSTPVTIDQRERRMFRIKWKLDSKTQLTLSFPADYQLITGANAIELEKIFERDLQRVIPMRQDDMFVDWEESTVEPLSQYKTELQNSGSKNALTSLTSKGLFVANKGNYLNDEIRSDIILKQKDGKLTLYLNPGDPQISIKNLLLTGISHSVVPMNLTIDCYGYKKKKIMKVSLQQFIGMCNIEGCKKYVGIKSQTDNEITAVLVALNSAMAYNHILSVKVPLRVLQEENVPISGTLYTYIPLQNITESFFTQDLK